MSKAQVFLPNQILYTIGYKGLVDGTQVMVSTAHKGGEIVSVVTGTKHIHFIDGKNLSITKPQMKTESLPVKQEVPTKIQATIPDYLKPVGATIIHSGRMVFIFNHPTIKNNSFMYVADGYIHNPNLTDIRLVDRTKVPIEYIAVPKENLYIQQIVHNQAYQQQPKPLATACKTLSDDHNYMIELLKEPNRDALINKVTRGVNMADYEIIKAPKYFVLVPKDYESLYLPMIMAHTDIVRSVSHPTDDNLEYDEKLDKFSSPRGLGADDRAGCYAINRILLKHPKKFIIALFDEEEIGCIGSGQFAISKEFERVNRLASCYISIDRRRGLNGAHQIATYDYDNKKLFDLVKTATDRPTVRGSSTDCKTLSAKSYTLPTSPGQTKLACFNMSCGYDNEHTASEVLYFGELQRVVQDFDALVDLAEELWEEPFAAVKTATNYGTNYSKSKTKHYNAVSHWPADSEIEVDGEFYDESDVRTLLYLYKQTFGHTYKFATAQYECIEPEMTNYIRLNVDCVVGGTYGGVKMTPDNYEGLNKATWIVERADDNKMRCDLLSEDGKRTATNVPYAWLQIVTVNDVLVENIGV